MEDGIMKVNHKTFSGGYRFKNFEAQPSKELVDFVSEGVLASEKDSLISLKETYDVLKAFGVTSFKGPQNAEVSTEGDIEPKEIKEFVINTIEAEPYNLSTVSLLSNNGMRDFVEGLKSLNKMASKAKVIIAIGDNEDDLISQIQAQIINLNWVEINTVTPKYPINMKELLIPTLLKRKYPVGYNAPHIGVVVLDVQQVLHISQVLQHQPITNRVVALSGPGWEKNLLINVPLGTQIKEITAKYVKKDIEVRLVKNSIMKDPAVTEEDVIDRFTSVLIALPENRERKAMSFLKPGKHSDSATNSFLSALFPNSEKTADTNLHGEHRACVSCTYCTSVCPVGLIPQLLHKHVDKDLVNERLADLKIFDCIECNLCNYGCPSKIDIAGDIVKGKSKLEDLDISHKKYQLKDVEMIRQKGVK
jgi:Na(+)-translocating NADH:ubiquinone oxidoreductase A subunit